MVVDFEDLASERRAPAVFEFVVGDLQGWCRLLGLRWEAKKRRGMLGKVAADDCLTHPPAIFRNGNEDVEAVGEPGEGAAELSDKWLSAERSRGAGTDIRGFPEAFASEVEKRVFWRILVVVGFDDFKARREAVAKLGAPWNSIGRGKALVDKVEHSEKEQRLVRPFMPVVSSPDDAYVETVEALDGLIESRHDVSSRKEEPRNKGKGQATADSSLGM